MFVAVEVGTSRPRISSIFKFILFCQDGVRNLDLDFPEWKRNKIPVGVRIVRGTKDAMDIQWIQVLVQSLPLQMFPLDEDMGEKGQEGQIL